MSTDLVNVPAGDQEAASQPEQVETAAMGAPTESVTAIARTEVIPPSGTLGTSGDFQFVETDYEPRPDVTPDEVAKLPDNDLLTGLKKQYRRTRQEMEVYLVYFDEAVRRFAVEQPRSDGGQFERKDQPLVKAFEAIDRHYETERKRAWRYRNALKTRLRLSESGVPTAGQRKYHEWDFVQDANSGEQIVVGNPKVNHVEIVPVGGTLEDAKVVPTSSLSRVPVKTITLNQLILCDDNGKRYRYAGNGLLKCAEAPKLVKQVQDRGAAAIKARQEQMNKDAQAATEEKDQRDKFRNAELCRRDLELTITKPAKDKTKAALEAEKKKKAENKAKQKAARAQKPAKPEKTKTKTELAEENKRAEEKAKQEKADRARKAKNETGTEAAVAPLARYSTDEDGKLDCLRQGEDGEQVVQ